MAGGDGILVLGASSYVGRGLMRRLGPERALGSYHSSPLPGGFRFDATRDDLASRIDEPSRFSHAVLLLGETQPDRCVARPEASQALNVDAVCAVVDQLDAWDIVPVFTSTEFVFDGARGNYREDDPPAPVLLYGRQKLAVERDLQQRGRPHLILRLAKVYGDAPGDGTLFADWLEAIEHGRPIRCATDQAFSPVHVDDVAAAIALAIERRLTGLYHLSGNRRFRRIELLQTFLKAYERRSGRADLRLSTCSIHDFELPEPRPVDVSLVADKLVAATGMAFRDPAEACISLLERAAQQQPAAVG